MMSVSNVSAGAAASGYYKAEGYYIAGSPEAEAAAIWFGKATETLAQNGQNQFSGRVDDRAFSEMLRGYAPPTEKDAEGNWKEGQTLGRIVDGERQHRPGIDLTFSASKSVSVMGLVAGDDQVIAAHDTAVKAAMTYVEKRFVTTRREVDGKMLHVPGQMVAGLFRHDTSRALDPQLHTHAVIQNMILGSDGKWTALSNEQIYTNKLLIGAIYRNELAQNLQEIGYSIDRVGKDGATEIRGVPQHLMDGFSKRRQEIEQALIEKGKDATAIDSALAALATRRNKTEGVDRAELKEAWLKEASTLGITRGDLTAIKDRAALAKAVQLPGFTREGEVTMTREQRANSEVEFAIRHVSERNPVYSADDLLRTALNRSLTTGIRDLEQTLDRKEAEGRLIPVHVTKLEQQRHDSGSFKAGDGFTGKLVDHGPAPYMHNPENRQSYFVTLDTKFGPHTVWGADLGPAVQQAGLEKDNRVHLAVAKSDPVTIRDNKTGQEISTHRNVWTASQLDDPGTFQKDMVEKTVRMFSDSSTLADEKAVIQAYRAASRQAGVKLPDYHFNHGLRRRSGETRLKVELNGSTLTDGQKDAVLTGLSDTGRFVGIQGYAGTGKTFMLDTLRKHAEKAGYQIEGAAPTNKAVGELQSAIPEATTVARRLLMAEGATGKENKSKTILVIDEAGMLSTRDMKAIMFMANEQRYARVILVGDTKQLDAVGAGNPFQQLQKAGMPTASMADIQRQKDSPALLDAVLHSIRGEIKEAFASISDIQTPVKGATFAGQIASNWINLHSSVQEKTGIVVLTNRVREEVNGQIRDALRTAGRLGADETPVSSLAALNLTRAEAGDARSYQVGNLIIPVKDIGGLGSRTVYKVSDTSARSNFIEITPEKGGDAHRIYLSKATRTATSLSAYEQVERGFSIGDKVKFSIPDKEDGIVNGERGTVTGVSDGQIQLQLREGQRVLLDTDSVVARGMQHAYAATAHDFQGATVDRIIVGMSASERLSHQKSFYVNISRAKEKVTLVTTDADKLADRIEKNTGERPTALDAYKQRLDDEAKARIDTDRQRGQQPPVPSKDDSNLKDFMSDQLSRMHAMDQPREITDRQADERAQEVEQHQKVKEGLIR